MAFQLFEKLLSFFRKPSKGKKKPALSSKKQKFWSNSTDTTVNDLPPPYTDAPNTAFNTEKLSVRNPSSSFVQICPHETLSFERLATIADLPNIKTNGKKIDALRPDPDQHHRGHDKDTKEPQDSCKPLGYKVDSYIGSLKGFGTYRWKKDAHVPGIVLSYHWEMRCLVPDKVKGSSSTELQEFLEKTNIQLCPHKNISDMEIVNVIYGIVNPNGKPADPIDRYLAKEVGHDCGICGTKIKVYKRKDGKDKTCRVDTKRYLGKGESAGDINWLAQCAVPEVMAGHS